MGANILDLVVNSRLRDGAMIDVDDQTIVVSDEPDIEPLLELVPLTPNHDAVAITVRFWTCHDRIHSCLGESPNSLKQIDDLLVLNLQLLCIGYVLILTTPTCAKVRTPRLDPLLGGLQHIDQACPGEALFHLRNLRVHLLAWDHKWNEHNEVVLPSDAFATKRDIVDRCREALPNLKAHGALTLPARGDKAIRLSARRDPGRSVHAANLHRNRPGDPARRHGCDWHCSAYCRTPSGSSALESGNS